MAQVGQRDTSLDARRGIASRFIPLGARMRERLPDWLSHWELWLALLLGGWLRLFALDRTSWLDDQTQLLDMARTAILRGMIPVTGIPSSVGFLNSPISIYLLLPIAAFTANPLPQTIALALLNVVGVAICYVAALRGFGRGVALWSALFFAVCPASVWYSRFLWQQNFIAPLLGLWALTLFAAVKTSGRRWFVAHILLLLVCILLHPTVAYLIPVTLIALWLSPHRPRLREYALAAFGALLLLLPTLLWELQSGWSDVLVLASSAQRSSRYDGEVAVALFNVLGAPGPQTLGAGTPFNQLMPLFNVLIALTVALFVVGWLLLTLRLWRRVRGAWRPAPSRTATWRDRGAWVGAITSDVRSDEAWRLSLVLWLWVTIPPVAMIRHSVTIFPHYLIVLYPGIFLVIGLGAAWIFSRARGAIRSVQTSQQSPRPVMFARVGLRAAPVALLIALLGGLTLQSALHTTSVTSPQYSVTEGYGYPLNTMLGAVDALNALQRSQGIANVDIIDIIGATPPPGFYNDLATLLRDERSTRSMLDSACLRLPGTGESLIVAEKANVPAAQLLVSLPNATKIGSLPLREGVPAAVYRVKPLSGVLPGETEVGGVTFGGADQPALRLEGFQRVAPNLVRLRWTVLTSTVSTRPLLNYHIQAAIGAPNRSPAQKGTSCSAVRWAAGDTLVTWVPVQAGDATPPLQVTAQRLDYPVFHAAGLTWFAGRPRAISTAKLATPGGPYILPGA
ncbi:MAG TPA: glycosyltransferase family 39 protein [Ktedonobacterales bacterium]|nr:glycosyltransferase family 39 protein [Ktedonobacterales bacterium]